MGAGNTPGYDRRFTGQGFVTLQPDPAMVRDLEDRITRLGESVDAFAGDLGVEIRWRAARRTPVLTGRARGNWRLGLDKPDWHVDVDFFDPDGTIGDAEAREIARNARIGMTLWITNGLPYIVPLDRGHSKKAPAGFIELTQSEIPFVARQLAKGLVDRLHGRGDRGPLLGRAP